MDHNHIAIDIISVSKIYRGNSVPAIDNVSLRIPEGQIMGLLGPNGAGKTTMIKMLCGLLSPDAGEIFIGGLSFKNRPEGIKKIIGVVPQDIALFPSLTARENLKVFGGIGGLKGKMLKQRIDELLPLFGLDNSAGRKVEHFSGGMKRRLNLIAGLMHDPRILFLDEPTVGVDVQSKKVIIDNIFEINRKGTTIVYTSHYLEEAENLCSSVAILDHGRVIARGSVKDLIIKSGNNSSLEDVFLSLTGESLRD
jgi:ABC-2 type transport system ATP-binding protein